MEKYDFDGSDDIAGQAQNYGEILSRGTGFGSHCENEEKYVSSPGGDVYYFVTHCPNKGARWLILTHGLGMDHTVFDAVRDEFSPFFNIITWDVPLHGMSEVYGDFSLDGCAEDLKAAMDAECVEIAFIAGHCIGGCIVQAFADLYPDKCLGLILIDTFPFGRELYGRSDFKRLEKLIAPLRALPSSIISSAMAGLFSATVAGERALKQVMGAQNTACVMDVLACAISELSVRNTPRYTFPVLDIVGESDRLGPIKGLNEAAAEKCGYILSPIGHAGHTPYLDNPREFNWALEGFLQ